MTIRGNFETHLTIRPAVSSAIEDLAAIAVEAGLKATHIVLNHGREPSQPMLTRHSAGTLESIIKEARELSARLASRGLEVCRIKIETDADNPGTPTDTRDATGFPAACHFEHHVKLLLPPSYNLTALEAISRRHDAHLSRNAFRHRPDGMQERFLTQRHYATGRDSALAALAALILDLQRGDFSILDQEAEYVVFDTNAGMDSGWIDSP